MNFIFIFVWRVLYHPDFFNGYSELVEKKQAQQIVWKFTHKINGENELQLHPELLLGK